MPDLTHFAQRLRVAIAAAGQTPADIARACEVSRAAVSKWTTGAAAPASRHLLTVSRETGASIDWLMTPRPIDMSRDAADLEATAMMVEQAREIRDALGKVLR